MTSSKGDTKSGNFSDIELNSLSLWDIPDISVKEVTAHSETIHITKESAKVLTVDEIEAMQKQAFEEAYSEGKQNGYKAGFQKGFDEGSKQGYDENLHLMRKQAAEFVNLLQSLNEPFKSLDEQVEQELVSLAMGVAAQIIRREIKIDPGQVLAAVREAISVLPLSAQKISLHLHPEDAELVRSALALDEMTSSWSITEKPLMTRGGCIVNTETSMVDVTVENRMTAVIANALGNERGEDN